MGPVPAAAICVYRQVSRREIGKAKREAVHVAGRAGIAKKQAEMILVTTLRPSGVQLLTDLHAADRTSEFWVDSAAALLISVLAPYAPPCRRQRAGFAQEHLCALAVVKRADLFDAQRADEFGHLGIDGHLHSIERRRRRAGRRRLRQRRRAYGGDRTNLCGSPCGRGRRRREA